MRWIGTRDLFNVALWIGMDGFLSLEDVSRRMQFLCNP